jgi:hypothetical protein
LTGLAKLWYKSAPAKDLKSWFNLRASVLEKTGECTIDQQNFILDFKQLLGETITQVWIRIKNFTCNLEHGLRDWMLLYSFLLWLKP